MKKLWFLPFIMLLAGCHYKSVELKWSALDNPHTQYRVYRSQDNCSNLELYATVNQTRYTDRWARRGKTYCYGTTAYDLDFLSESNMSEPVIVTVR